MAGVKTTGSGFPRPETLLGILDDEARGALNELREAAQAAMSQEAPQRTHKLVDGFTIRVSRTKTGQKLVVQPQRGKVHDGQATVAEVARWVTRGTGLFRAGGGGKRRIRSSRRPPRRMVLPGGQRRWSVKGQHPNPFLARVRDKTDLQAGVTLDKHARQVDERMRRLS